MCEGNLKAEAICERRLVLVPAEEDYDIVFTLCGGCRLALGARKHVYDECVTGPARRFCYELIQCVSVAIARGSILDGEPEGLSGFPPAKETDPSRFQYRWTQHICIKLFALKLNTLPCIRIAVRGCVFCFA